MAQSGYTPIQLYYSATTTNVPLAANLAAGELAINTADGKLFYKDSSNVVQVLATKGGVGSSSNTQVLYNSSGLVVGSANLTFNGTTLTAAGFSGPLNGTVGATTPNTGAFTTLSASSTVSGTGFSTYLASPPAIGGTAAAAGSFTTLSASSTVSGTGFSTYLASPPAIGGTAAAAGSFTTLTASTSITQGGVAVPTISSTSTLTNKWIQPRVLASTANSATPTLNTDSYDMMVITGQSVAITSFTTNLTGTPVNGQKLIISITGTGAIAITWGASFESSTVTLPTTTVTTNRLDVGFIWNVATSKWRCVASA